MSSSEKKTPETPREVLFAPLTYCKGVGPSRAAILNRIGLRRPADLLFYFPRDYRDLSRFVRIADLVEDEDQTTRGSVVAFHRRFTRRGPLVTLEIEDHSGARLEGIWFNQAWVFEQFAYDRRLFMTGKPILKNGRMQMSHPRLTWIGNASDAPLSDDAKDSENSEETVNPELDPFLPIYPLTEGLHQHHLHKIIKNLLLDLPDALEEVFPNDYLSEHHLLPIAEAVRKIHFPKTLDEARDARRRFIYQELLLLQLALSIRRQQHEVGLKAPALPWSEKIRSRIARMLPFDLTDAQKRVVGEITADLARPVPMNRLLQGDVGSGKTIVATIAMLQTVAGGYQAVLMAPTEVLARQHYRFLTRLLENSEVQVVPLLGGQRPKDRAVILEQIQDGRAKIIIGTQAIVCNEIPFHRLGLIVIDEQHKFGVRQRALLKTGTGADPHYLVMTATPIPRSVTMTVFGDLDVSILDALPPGRQSVKTYVVDEERRAKWWDFFRKKIAQGRQGYVVVPRVDDADDGLKNVSDACEELKRGELAGFRLGVLHGRMSSEEKERIMLDFRSRTIEVLISTSVIEVGVDVPNATLMTIEDGNMFGLAQLHQLRGRIGRGKFPGFCAVFVTPSKEKDEKSPPKPMGGRQKKAKTARDKTKGDAVDKTLRNDPASRLKIFADSTDGFLLAEKDFEMRGPGDLFGTEQHGLCHFRIANLVRDKKVVEEARVDAAAMVQADPGLSDPKHHSLRRQVLVRYGQVLDLGDVG